MQIIMTITFSLVYGAWAWTFGRALIRAKAWPDLATSLALLLISYVYAMVYVWRLEGFFPSEAFGMLIMPLIEAVYGNWL